MNAGVSWASEKGFFHSAPQRKATQERMVIEMNDSFMVRNEISFKSPFK